VPDPEVTEGKGGVRAVGAGLGPSPAERGGRRVPAVVLAGARCKGSLLEATRQPYKALVRVAGKTLLDHCLEGLRRCETVADAVVVGPAECRSLVAGAGPQFSWLPCGETLLDNLLAGAQAVGGSGEMILACAADAPLIGPAEVDRVVSRSLDTDKAFLYPIVSREVSEAAFPGCTRTYARLRDGRFTGGNLMLVSRRLLLENADRIAAAFAARKKPFKLARMLGLWFAIRVPFGKVTIAEAEERAGRILGLPVAAVICEDAAIGMDVDKAEDLAIVEAALAARLLGTPQGRFVAPAQPHPRS